MKMKSVFLLSLIIAILIVSMQTCETIYASTATEVSVTETDIGNGKYKLKFSATDQQGFFSYEFLFSYDNTVIIPIDALTGAAIDVNDPVNSEKPFDFIVPDPFVVTTWETDYTTDRSAFHLFGMNDLWDVYYGPDGTVDFFEFYYMLDDGKTTNDLNCGTFRFVNDPVALEAMNITAGVALTDGMANLYMWGSNGSPPSVVPILMADSDITVTYTNSQPVAPNIDGPSTMTLSSGYASTSTGEFVITGCPTPTVTQDNNHGGKIMWNNITKKLDIATGISKGTYTVVLAVSNGVTPNANHSFVLTVNDAPIAKSITVGTQSGTLTAGTAGFVTFPVTTKNVTSGSVLALTNINAINGISLDSAATTNDNTVITIRTTSAITQGSHPLTLTADGVTSSPFTLVVDAPAIKVNTQAPNITSHPKDMSVYTGNSVTLSVTANATDGGDLTYQWYRSASPSDGSTAISGATSQSYSPSTSASGTTYYFVVVTNTNNNATGSKTATATSGIAAVTVNSYSTGDSSGVSNDSVDKYPALSPPANFFDSGENTYVKGSNAPLVHITQKDLSNFNNARMDNIIMTRDIHYKAENGSTKITVYADYLDTLSFGKHTLTIRFSDGVTVSADFTIEAEPMLTATTEPIETSTPIHIPTIEEPFINPFVDVQDGAWYFDYIMYVYKHGFMSGTNVTPMMFSPDIPLTRGMIVTIFYRHANLPDVTGLSDLFDDVNDGMWYKDAITWAAANGIASGYGDSNFGPNYNITRQDLAFILARYADFTGMELPATQEYKNFLDEADIANYAKEAIERLCEAGVISGKPGNLFDPQGNATRAEAAAMLKVFFELTK